MKASTSAETVTLTVGSDWKDGTDYSKTLPKAGSVPSDSDAINGADTTGCMDVEPVDQVSEPDLATKEAPRGAPPLVARSGSRVTELSSRRRARQ